MANDVIPDDVKQFILQNIDSIAQLECLLLLRAQPGRQWDAAAIAKELYIDPQQANVLLSRLLAQGWVGREENQVPVVYHYVTDPAFDAVIGRLADVYKKYLVPVTHLIHAKPKSKIQEFADAFRIKKD